MGQFRKRYLMRALTTRLYVEFKNDDQIPALDHFDNQGLIPSSNQRREIAFLTFPTSIRD
jgi:hypothetical protein